MKTFLTAILATLALATSAMAKIGETPRQVVADAQRDKDAVAMAWKHETFLVEYRNGDLIAHQFGSNNREIAFDWLANHNVTNTEIGKVQRIFRTKWYPVQERDPSRRMWLSDNDLAMSVEGNYLRIFVRSKLVEVKQGTLNTPKAVPVAPEPTIVPPAPTKDEARLHRAQTSQKEPRPIIDFVPDKTVDLKDCLIVATEAFARLKPTANWVKIAGFTWIKNTKEAGRHAVAFFQPTADTNVFMYDKSGSYEIPTKSHDLNEIVASLNQLLRRANIAVQSPKWLESDGSIKEFADAAGKSNRQPIWSATQHEQNTQHAMNTMEAISVILGLIGMTVAGVFARYHGLRVWPFALLSEPVYLMIEAIRTEWKTRKTCNTQ